MPIIAISHSQAAMAPDVPIAAVIHHGLDPEAFSRGEGDGGYFLFLGRMVPEKGARRAALIAHLADVPLKIAAKMREPWEQQFYAEQVQPLLGGGVEYVGEVSGAERDALLRGAKALVNPIRWRMVRCIRRVDEIDRSACRAVAETRFSTRRMVGEHLALFERLLAQRRRSRRPGGQARREAAR